MCPYIHIYSIIEIKSYYKIQELLRMCLNYEYKQQLCMCTYIHIYSIIEIKSCHKIQESIYVYIYLHIYINIKKYVYI
jgi:hypothetical protein